MQCFKANCRNRIGYITNLHGISDTGFFLQHGNGMQYRDIRQLLWCRFIENDQKIAILI